MPELFSRMGQRMATNPAGAFQGMIEEMSRMEEPAMRDIRLGADEERAIGRRAREEYLRRAEARGWSVDRDPDRLRYMQDLVDTIAPLMSHRDRYPEVEVTLVEAPIPDGQCFPGGYLVFTTAMLDEPDEATVIAVVAHELAHLDLGHVYEYARRSKLAEATFTAPQAPGPAAFDQFFTRGMALFGLMMNPYRPEHESEADCLATTWLYLRGYDPEALVRFLERMHDRLRDQPDQAVPFLPFGRSHPFTLDRRRDVAQRLAQLQRWRARDDLGLFPDNLRTLRSRLRVHAEGR